jgi:serine/threonine-protein kinase
MTWLPDATLDHLRAVAAEPDLSGTQYDLLERIGAGGMGAVYRVRDRQLERDVALKVLHAAATPHAAQRLLDEARILARLEHPGIVPVHDAGRLPDGRVFYVMKLVRGTRLDEHVREVEPLAARLRLCERICEAVAFAHAHGVIHRDLKPQNVMIGSFGEVLVLDWGVARLREAAVDVRVVSADPPREPSVIPRPPVVPRQETADGTVVGTPGYMAPEQARGEVDRIDERTDVYAIGALIHFLTSSQPGVPRAVTAIAARASALDPADRYRSVRDLSADIGRFLAGLAVDALPESVFDRGRRVLAKYRTPILLVLAYLVMRLVLLAWTGR